MAIVEVITRDRVLAVNTASQHSSLCLCLELEGGQKKLLNLDVFLSSEANIDGVIAKFKSLKGKEVKLFCWDPDRQPGKWSSNDWFKEVKVFSSHELMEENIKRKGHCKICGIADGLLSCSDDHGQSWYHYNCQKNR